jgi:multimeric flavodoxin WrbA
VPRILIIYHSQQYGDTESLAQSIAEGVREAGARVELINTNEHRVNLYKFLSADGIALGTPDYYSYPAGTIKTFFDDIYLWDKAGEPVKGKPAILFFSCGGGGNVKLPFETLAGKFFNQVKETLESIRPLNNETTKKCHDLGKALVNELGNS